MIAGFAVLAIVHFKDLGITTASGSDFEQILPAAIQRVRAARRARADRRRPARRFRLHVRGHAERRTGVRGQRHLPATHQSEAPADDDSSR